MSKGNAALLIGVGLLILYLGATGRYKYLKGLIYGNPEGDENMSVVISDNIDKNIKELNNLTPLKSPGAK